MKTARQSISVIVVGLVLISVTCAFAQDWPGWRGANHDGKVTGFTAPATWPTELAQGWKVPVGTGDASPALVGDKIYVFARQGGDEVTQCLNVADGKPVWTDKYAVPPLSGGADRDHGGPRSSPAVGEGKVVTLGVTGVLSCLDAATGKPVWRRNEIQGTPKFHTSFSPMIVDGMVIAHLGGSQNGTIVAYDLATANEKWKWTGEGPGYASPALMTVDGVKMLVTLTEKSVLAIGLADGKLAWQIPFATTGMGYNAATPVIDGQTVIYTGDGRRGTKAVKIEKQGDKFAATPLWNCPTGTKFNTPVLKDGMLYGITENGNFFCVNAKDGKVAWTDTVNVGQYGAVLDAGSVILALPCAQRSQTPGANMFAFKPDAAKYTELAKIKVAGSPVFASPVIAGNKVFVKDQDSLAMLTIK